MSSNLNTIIGSLVGNMTSRVKTLETETKLPVYTSSTLPASPATGDTVYSSDDTSLKTWSGSAWVSITLS